MHVDSTPFTAAELPVHLLYMLQLLHTCCLSLRVHDAVSLAWYHDVGAETADL